MTFREKNKSYRKEISKRPYRRGYERVTKDSECFERTPKHIGAERMRPGTTDRFNRFQTPGFEGVRENRRAKARLHRHHHRVHGTHEFSERHYDRRPRVTTRELLHERHRLEQRIDFLRSRLCRINHRLHHRFAHHREMAEG